MLDFQSLLFAQLTKYPGMQLEDCIKLAYQSAMGPGHLVGDACAFSQLLRQELETPGLLTAQPLQPEELGRTFSRVHLSGFDKAPCIDTFTRLCALSAEEYPGDEELLRASLGTLRRLGQAGMLPYTAQAVEECINEYIQAGCPQPRHSERYRALYQPHYRVLARDYAFYLPVFAAIDVALGQKPHVLVGIDGMSGAGKSRLAALLQRVYGCGVVHTDDFFLRPEQRREERLAAPGGNIDYERLAPVAAMAADDRAFAYTPFDCQAQAFGARRDVSATRLTLLEGVYALHPEVNALCDLRIFLSVEAQTQAARVLARSGQALAKRFLEEWIPMENRYFVEFGIRDRCELRLDTTAL